MCSAALWPQDVGRGRGLDECARCGGEFVVRGNQRVCLQLGQCDVLGLVERLAADDAAPHQVIAGAGTARRLPLQVIATRGAHDSALRKADPRTGS